MTNAHFPVRDVVVDIWTKILEADIDDDADFFELGGHSLLATRMIARIGQDLGVQITLRELLDHAMLSEFLPLVESKVATIRR